MSTPAAYRSFWARAPHERRALALRLDDSDDLSVHVEDVVGSPRGQRELTDGDTLADQGIGVGLVLDPPARLGEHRVDLLAGLDLVERRGPLGALHDRLTGGGGHLAGADTLAVVLPLVGRAQLGDLCPQPLDLLGIGSLRALGMGDQFFGLAPGAPLGFETVAGLGQLDARLGQRPPVSFQRFLELRHLLGVGGGHLRREGWRDERGDGPCPAHGPVEEVAQLPAQLQRFECLRRVEEVVVRGVVAAPAQLVEGVAAPADQHTRAGECVEAVELGGALDTGGSAGDELLRQDLPELVALTYAAFGLVRTVSSACEP